MRKTLEGILDYLGLNIDGAETRARLDCLEKFPEGLFHREHKNGTIEVQLYRDDREVVKKIRSVIRKGDKILFGRTGRHLPLDRYKYYM